MKYKILILILFLFSCSTKTPKEPQEKILVDIDGKATISVNEFLRRAEYVPRPDYCKANTYIHKKIILNSLIAEKLLALEAGNDSPLLENIEFQNYIKGHKEQAMRQYMHHVEATDKVVLDNAELTNAYKFAGREYDVAYFTIVDSSVAEKAHDELVQNPQQFDEFYFQMTGQKNVPNRKVQWNSDEHVKLHQTLFSQDITKGQVLSPIKFDENGYLFIKILGWTDTKVITEKQQRERLDQITEKLTEIKASAIWENRVSEIMRGKRMDFNKDVFNKMAEILYASYFPTSEEKKDIAINQLWQQEDEQNPKSLQDMSNEVFLQEPFFTIDGNVWTVDDFRNALMSHPLVFRTNKVNPNEFPQQLRLAIADLVRDHFITQQAYKAGYDKVNIVERNVNMWKDTFFALNEKHQFLDSVHENRDFAKNYHEILDETLNPYINKLQEKYYKKVKLDFKTFEDISLSSIDLLVMHQDQPYKYVVPLFPIITNDHLIEYVDKIH